jgi:hypothetical protein
MKTILFVISSQIFYRNYISTNSLSDLLKNYKIIFLISDDVILENFNYDNSFFYKKNYNQIYKHQILFNMYMFRYRNISKSFNFRIRRLFNLDFSFSEKNSLFGKIIRIIWRSLRIIIIYGFYYLLSIKFIFPFFLFVMNYLLKCDDQFDFIFNNNKIDLVIFPSSAYEYESFDLIDLCEKNKIPSLFLIDNWDNLSSKSILWKKPSHICVWGEQTKNHAIEIQGISSDKITIIGTPRFDNYFNIRHLNIKSKFNFNYFLFLGSFLPFDELMALKKINSFIENSDKFSSYKIIYRPHPWRLNNSIIDISNLKSVIIDPQLENQYLSGSNSVNFQPDISYYPSLLKNSSLILGGLTSMMIESIIFEKKYIALAYEDKYLTNGNNMLFSYTHFDDIKKLNSIIICYNLNDIDDIILNNTDINFVSFDNERQFFLYNDSIPYSERLLSCCNTLLNE